MPNRRLMPDVVCKQELAILTPQTPVLVAVRKMVGGHISAVMLTEDGTAASPLLGIFTERDLTVRVVAAGRDSRRTRLGTVMTEDPDTLPPHATALDALVFMQNRNYRHLPIVEDGQVLGMVSIRNLFAVVTEQLEDDVHYCESFVFGSGYSLDTVKDRYNLRFRH